MVIESYNPKFCVHNSMNKSSNDQTSPKNKTFYRQQRKSFIPIRPDTKGLFAKTSNCMNPSNRSPAKPQYISIDNYKPNTKPTVNIKDNIINELFDKDLNKRPRGNTFDLHSINLPKDKDTNVFINDKSIDTIIEPDKKKLKKYWMPIKYTQRKTGRKLIGE